VEELEHHSHLRHLEEDTHPAEEDTHLAAHLAAHLAGVDVGHIAVVVEHRIAAEEERRIAAAVVRRIVAVEELRSQMGRLAEGIRLVGVDDHLPSHPCDHMSCRWHREEA